MVLIQKNKTGNKFDLERFFDNYLQGPNIFKHRDAMDGSYIPSFLPHRDNQLKQLALITACVLKDGNPSNIFIYGKTGTGKTASVKHLSKKINDKCRKIGIRHPVWLFINCKQVKSAYRVIAKICNLIEPENPVSSTGTPTDVLVEKMLKKIDKRAWGSVCFIVLDEIDALKDTASKSNILYLLSRANESLKHSKVNIIGISNVLNFKNDLDPRVISSLCEEEIVYPSYNAVELYDILKERANIAFYPNTVSEGAIRLCAAIAAKENGDARRALSLLRKAGEIVERRNLTNITEDNIYEAQKKIDVDKTVLFIKNIPIQQKMVLLAIYLNYKYSGGNNVTSGEVYNTYVEIQKSVRGTSRLTARRVMELVKELDMIGITSSYLKSFGRSKGRTRLITIAADPEQVELGFADDYRWEELIKNTPSNIIRPNLVSINGQNYKKLM